MSTISFDKHPFAEGGSRRAYKGCVVSGNYAGFEEGTQLVLKVIKSSAFREGVRLTEAHLQAQALTRQYALAFNATVRPPSPVYVCVATLLAQSDSNAGSQAMMLLEPFLDGEYEKFNSNSGWSSSGSGHIDDETGDRKDGSDNIPDCFSHWTWVHSHGKHLVCDLKGHRGRPAANGCYLFTDPVVLSQRAGQFGCTDLGQRGIHDWFALHTCNELCHSAGIAKKRPKCCSYSGKPCLRQTTYTG
uniref:Alpha-type protein kinase domain-containing protein n=1 Tax=Cyclophora tenuis TaxID=216820 RepID=A0A7S1DCG5_CYCTE|mmetsp:Transcript_7801/g.13460  ORF Transcript_7801/g.13460 Transcript_7801/m.13460 type:complete len:245 (+) Transcript_7801:105-839(+)